MIDPEENPAKLRQTLWSAFAPEEDEEFNKLDEVKQLERVVHAAFSAIYERATLASDRACLLAHVGLTNDFDLQMQRVAAVQPQTDEAILRAYGRPVKGGFAAHSAVPADEMQIKQPSAVEVAVLQHIESMQKQQAQAENKFKKAGPGKLVRENGRYDKQQGH